MLEDGYSIRFISSKYGINCNRLSKLWLLYQEEGSKVLYRHPNVRSDGEFRLTVVLDIEKKWFIFGQSLDKVRSKCPTIEHLVKDI